MFTLILLHLLVTSPKLLHVSDGDTIVMKTDDGFEVRGRLIGIDCPEVPHKAARGRKKQPGQALGEEAKARLETLLKQPFSAKSYGSDVYGRSLVELRLADGKIANLSLVEEGYCEVYRKANKRGEAFNLVPYDEAEKRARQAKKGIWGLAHYEPPGVYRRRYLRD